MHLPHTIRLRGPWEFSIAGTAIARRIDFPCTWQALLSAVTRGGDEPPSSSASGGRRPPGIAPEPTSLAKSVTLRRRFHKPTGLEGGDRVRLSLRPSGALLAARLNGQPLTLTSQTDGAHHADIAAQLADHNELSLELAPPSPALPDSDAPVLDAIVQIWPPK